MLSGPTRVQIPNPQQVHFYFGRAGQPTTSCGLYMYVQTRFASGLLGHNPRVAVYLDISRCEPIESHKMISIVLLEQNKYS